MNDTPKELHSFETRISRLWRFSTCISFSDETFCNYVVFLKFYAFSSHTSFLDPINTGYPWLSCWSLWLSLVNCAPSCFGVLPLCPPKASISISGHMIEAFLWFTLGRFSSSIFSDSAFWFLEVPSHSSQLHTDSFTFLHNVVLLQSASYLSLLSQNHESFWYFSKKLISIRC